MAELQTQKTKNQRLKQEVGILKQDSMICKNDFENFKNKTESLMNEIDFYKQKNEDLKNCFSKQTIDSIV